MHPNPNKYCWCYVTMSKAWWPGRIVQSEGHLTREPEVLALKPSPTTHATDSRNVVVIYWQKYVHLVLVSC